MRQHIPAFLAHAAVLRDPHASRKDLVLPQVRRMMVEHYPNVVYLILGATHPHVIQHEGESGQRESRCRIDPGLSAVTTGIAFSGECGANRRGPIIMSWQHLELLRRHKLNPILTAADWPYPINSVLNPGATLLPHRMGDRWALIHPPAQVNTLSA